MKQRFTVVGRACTNMKVIVAIEHGVIILNMAFMSVRALIDRATWFVCDASTTAVHTNYSELILKGIKM